MMPRLTFPDQVKQLNILVIDDQEFDRKMICNRLQEALPTSPKLTEAADAASAAQMINEAMPPFDCIMMDMNLPDMHAVDLTTMLVGLKPEICIVIITAEADMDKALKCLKAGAEDFLIKGEYSNESLYRAIRYSIERRQASIENLKLHQELKHAREISSLQKEFIHLVSHEFRTPIAIISGAMQLLSTKFPEIQAGGGSAQFTKIDQALKRLVGLLETVMRLNMLDEGKNVFNPAQFDMRELIMKAVENTDSKRITAPKMSFPIHYYGDRSMLEFALENVVSNALKYSAKDSPVTIEIQEGNDCIDIKVIDTGVGMSKQTLAKLGEKFFRDDATSHIEGTGLGIHLVKRFISHHGGELVIESEKGKGTTVTMHLPTYKAPEE